MNFNESKTKQNLAWAFAAECQAGARYQFIATQAQMSKMFYLKDTMKMLAKNEMAHAKLYYDYIIEKCGEEFKVEYDANYPYVCLDLQKSLVGEKNIERDEFEKIYPKFACIAREEGFVDIANSFELVAKVENTHSSILDFIAKNMAKNSLYSHKQKVLMKCSNCGHAEILSEAWKKCPLCNLEQGYIELCYSDAIMEALQKNNPAISKDCKSKKK